MYCIYFSDLKKGKTFEEVYNPLEEIAIPLNTAWATVKNLNYVAVSEEYNKTFLRVTYIFHQ